MCMTITEKILAKAAGKEEVKAGEIVTAEIDLAMIQDALGPIVYRQFRELNIPIWDKQKVFTVIDHFCLPGSVENAKIISETAKFARDYAIPNFYNMQGVSHQIIVESGNVLPGQVAVGTDSHTCTYGALGAFSTGIGSTEMCSVLALGKLWFKVPETIKVNVIGKLPEYVMSKDIVLKLLSRIGANGATYKALEFSGDTIKNMSMDSRFTLCNMAVEAGAKNGIIAPDEKTISYLRECGAAEKDYSDLFSDKGAKYTAHIEIDAASIVPQVALPYSPANSVDITDIEGASLDQVIVGACTNGRVEDLKIVAEIIGGHKIPHGFKCFIVPASNRVYTEAAERGYLSILSKAGCIIVNPGCGGCGIQMPMAGKESCLGTHNRNFCGRMGDPESIVYLASPAVAAASALTGKITDPRNID